MITTKGKEMEMKRILIMAVLMLSVMIFAEGQEDIDVKCIRFVNENVHSRADFLAVWDSMILLAFRSFRNMTVKGYSDSVMDLMTVNGVMTALYFTCPKYVSFDEYAVMLGRDHYAVEEAEKRRKVMEEWMKEGVR